MAAIRLQKVRKRFPGGQLAVDDLDLTIADGELFVMGDHRSSSADSRAFGPIPVDAVIGGAWLRYWPFDTFGILERPAHPELQTSRP